MDLKIRFKNMLTRLNGDEFIKLWREDCFDDSSMKSEIMADMPDYADYLIARDKVREKFSEAPVDHRFMYVEPFLNKEQEQHIFRKYNYLKYKFKNLIESSNAEIADENLITTAEFYLKELNALKYLMIGAVSRLVVNIVKKKNRKDFEEACSDGYYGLSIAVDYFNYTKIGKNSGERIRFTTYAYWVIMDKIIKGKVYQTEEVSNKEEIIDINEIESLFEKRLDNKNFLADVLKYIHPREQSVLKYYYGIGETPLNIREISKVMRITRARVGHIKDEAIKKIRRRAAHMV